MTLKHEAGRDTVALFGDGTFQIMDRNPSALVDLDHSRVLEADVYRYKAIDHSLFVHGRQGYTVIDLKRKEIQQYIVSDLMPESPYDYKRYVQDDLLPVYGDRYKKLTDFSQFTVDEQKQFKDKRGEVNLKTF